MLVFILMFSICAGLLSAFLLYFFSKRSSHSHVEQVQESLQKSLLEYQKQMKHMKRQKERLMAKNSSPELVRRYEEDILLLARRMEELKHDVLQLWMYRTIKEIQHGYLDDVASFPETDFRDSSQESYSYSEAIVSLHEYLERIQKNLYQLRDKKFSTPLGIMESKEMHLLHKKRESFLLRYETLIQKADRLHDQFQYLSDVSKVKKMHEIEEERQEVEEVLGDVSSYLYEQSLDEEEPSFQLSDHSEELAAFASDIQAQLSAEHEVQQYMRSRIRTRHEHRRTTQK